MSPEVRLSYNLELLSSKAFKPYNWTSPITRGDFDKALHKAMQLIGMPHSENTASMAKIGIISRKALKRAIRRKEAFAKMFAALEFLSKYDYVSLPAVEEAKINFADYKTPAEHKRAMGYLVNRGVIRGFTDGNLHADRSLINRDCVFLVSRLYEAVSSDRKNAAKQSRLTFIDLPTNHWIITLVERIDSAGAFTYVKLGPKFDGDSWLNVSELAGMVSGILVHFNRSDILPQVNALCERVNRKDEPDRKFLAQLLAIMLRGLSHLYPSVNEKTQIKYTDIKAGSPLEYDLMAIANYGIQLGYVGGRFAGHEKITRFEAIGTIHAAIKEIIDTECDFPKPDGSNKILASKPFDVDDFVARIHEKQARIREILSRNGDK
jgi:hypothetical protein